MPLRIKPLPTVAPGDPARVSIDLGGASKLVVELRGIAEVALAQRIDDAVSKSQALRQVSIPSGLNREVAVVTEGNVLLIASEQTQEQSRMRTHKTA